MTEPQDPLKLPFGALNNIDEATGGRRQRVSPDENWLDLVTTAGINSLIPNTPFRYRSIQSNRAKG